MPAFFWCGVLVAVMEPTDHEVEPPVCGFFSSRITLRPRRATSDAAASPVPPEPWKYLVHHYAVFLVNWAIPFLVQRWDRRAPLVMHCYAGISRSTAGAFITACALNPGRDEAAIARAIRGSSKTAMPNIMLVGHADRILGRKGRMIAAVEGLGPGIAALEGEPFRLDLE